MKILRSRVLATLLLALPLTFSCNAADLPGRKAASGALPRSGKALFEEKCRTGAGEKIYRKVESVEGLLLLKVRPAAGAREWADPMWPGAAFAIEASGDSFINTFLGSEYAPGDAKTGRPMAITPQSRGFIDTDRKPGGLPGYRYVDIVSESDGKRYRYRGRWEEPWQSDKTYLKGYVKFSLEKAPAPDPAPRYGVTFEDHLIPAERALWVASSTVKVIDLESNEVLGEMTRYAWSPSAPSRANPSPWLTAMKCPGHAYGSDAATRKFVDQVLTPRREM